MNPIQFSRLCSEHDWTYEFSDDQTSWRRGRDQRRILVAAYTQTPSLLPIFNEWAAWINSPGTLPKPQVLK